MKLYLYDNKVIRQNHLGRTLKSFIYGKPFKRDFNGFYSLILGE